MRIMVGAAGRGRAARAFGGLKRIVSKGWRATKGGAKWLWGSVFGRSHVTVGPDVLVSVGGHRRPGPRLCPIGSPVAAAGAAAGVHAGREAQHGTTSSTVPPEHRAPAAAHPGGHSGAPAAPATVRRKVEKRPAHRPRKRHLGDGGRRIPRRIHPWQLPPGGAGSTGRIVVSPAFLQELERVLTGHLATADEVDRLARRQVDHLDLHDLVVDGDLERCVRSRAADAVEDHAGTRHLPPLLARDVGYVVDALARAERMDAEDAFGTGAVGALVATLAPGTVQTTRSRVGRWLTALEPPTKLPTTPQPAGAPALAFVPGQGTVCPPAAQPAPAA
ncbi:MAG TPA: hypothetical protein VFJ85_09285 [Acidimicrobiales bacterium]|nr:hypothetical protein [Acidimicrobiales bacterium]